MADELKIARIRRQGTGHPPDENQSQRWSWGWNRKIGPDHEEWCFRELLEDFENDDFLWFFDEINRRMEDPDNEAQMIALRAGLIGYLDL